MTNHIFSAPTFRKTLAVFSLAFAFSVLMPTYAHAAVLSVDFTPDPLFKANNFLPSDAVSGTVEVENTDAGSHNIVTEAINVSDDDGFGAKLHLVIKDASNTTYYNGGFGAFLTSGTPTALGTLAPAEKKTFTYTVSFLDMNDNTYQGSTLGFDLCVGFADGAVACGDTEISPEIGGGGDGGGTGGDGDTDATIPGSGSGGGGGGGGGGGSTSPSLQISNESVASVDAIAGTATIEWDTNLYATSQVLYGPASGTYTLSLVLPYLPFFGYPSGTAEDTTKVLHHSVSITGLTPGETYKYRVVSRASPPTTSFERQFTVLSGGLATASGGTGTGGSSGGSSGGSGGGSGGGSSGVLAHADERAVSGAGVGEAGSDPEATLAVGGNGESGQGAVSGALGAGGAGGADAGAEVTSANTSGRENNLLAAVLGGIPTWIRDNLNCIAYAGLLLAAVYLLAMFIPWRNKEGAASAGTGFMQQRKTPFLISACTILAITGFLFGWCLTWPFVVLSLFALVSSAVHHGSR